MLVLWALAVAYAVTAASWSVPGGIDVPSLPGTGNGSQKPLDPRTSDVEMYLLAVCEDEDRNSVDSEDPRVVIFDLAEYFDGTATYEDYQHIFPNDFMVKPNPGPVSGDNRWSPEPSLSLEIDTSNPKSKRWEAKESAGGSCYSMYRQVHHRYDEGDFVKSYDNGWKFGSLLYYVDWDGKKEDCEKIGGAWLGDSGYKGYQCCGDDYIWIYNNAVNYKPMSTAGAMNLAEKDELCLYSEYPKFGLPVAGSGYGYGSDSYLCDWSMGHLAYDARLKLDDSPQDALIANKTQQYFFAGQGDTETDVGKWTDNSGAASMFCDVYFDSAKGTQFRWMGIGEAANSDQVNCELYLGYEWTGTRCCGVPGSPASYSDKQPECSIAEKAGTAGGNTTAMPPVAFEGWLLDVCKNEYTLNRACFNSSAVDNDTIFGSSKNMSDMYNLNGELLQCGGGLGLTDTAQCTVVGSAENPVVCTYANDTWYRGSDKYATDTLLFKQSASLENITQKVHASSVPDGADVKQETECCFSNACWTGTECVGQAMLYELHEGDFTEYDSVKKSNSKVYICQYGEWIGPLDMQYDWYYNIDDPWYCLDDYQCFCRDGDCMAKYVYNGCTNIGNFFTGDHFCEGREWTSRTKLVATQLMAVAGDEYTLFCDRPQNSVNYPEPLAISNINNVCVLLDGGRVIMGTTFNSADDPLVLDADKVLMDLTGGFIPVVLGESSLASCNNALTGSATGTGSYRRCQSDNGQYYYNQKTQSLIWSDEPVAAETALADNYGQMNSVLESKVAELYQYISTHDTGIINMKTISHANHYDRMYYSRGASYEVFGIIEDLYDHERDSIRHFLGVIYDGLDIGCSQVANAYPEAYCGESGTKVFVFDKRVDDSFSLWTDLTAELRYG